MTGPRSPVSDLSARSSVSDSSPRSQASDKDREDWIENEVIPALAQTHFFYGSPIEFLRGLAESLQEMRFCSGEKICDAKQIAASMLVVLEGTIELEAIDKTKVGTMTKGGFFGEAELCGLLDRRVFTARALADCRVLVVEADAMRQAMQSSQASANGIEESFDALIALRREQVEKGIPFKSLDIGADAESIGVHVAALHAERLPLGKDELLEPLPDSSSDGGHILIFCRGKFDVELAATGKVMSLVPGAVVDEGSLAQRGASIRPLTKECEVYRLREFELIAASRCAGAHAENWFYRLQLLGQESGRKLHTKLTSAKGIEKLRRGHRSDANIRDMAARRQRSLIRAEELREQHAQTFDRAGGGKEAGGGACCKLPLLPGKNMGTTQDRFWQAGPMRVPPELEGQGIGSAVNIRMGVPRTSKCPSFASVARSENARAPRRMPGLYQKGAEVSKLPRLLAKAKSVPVLM